MNAAPFKRCYCTARRGLLAAALLAALTLLWSTSGRSQTASNRARTRGPRAVAVLEFDDKKQVHLLPVTIMAACVANSTAFSFNTGNAPGSPRQTGQTWVFGGAPNLVEHEQKILVVVRSWTWTSRPMTGSYFVRADCDVAGRVAI